MGAAFGVRVDHLGLKYLMKGRTVVGVEMVRHGLSSHHNSRTGWSRMALVSAHFGSIGGLDRVMEGASVVVIVVVVFDDLLGGLLSVVFD